MDEIIHRKSWHGFVSFTFTQTHHLKYYHLFQFISFSSYSGQNKDMFAIRGCPLPGSQLGTGLSCTRSGRQVRTSSPFLVKPTLHWYLSIPPILKSLVSLWPFSGTPGSSQNNSAKCQEAKKTGHELISPLRGNSRLCTKWSQYTIILLWYGIAIVPRWPVYL